MTFAMQAAPNAILQQPRNPWTRARIAQELMRQGRLAEAERCLDTIRYHKDVPDEIFDVFRRQLSVHGSGTAAVVPIDTPAEYLASANPRLRQPFRRIRAGDRFPSPYPFGLALPPHVGSGNTHLFLRDAATALAPDAGSRIGVVHVIVAVGPEARPDDLFASLQRQDFSGQLRVSLFDPSAGASDGLPGGLDGEVLPVDLLDPAAEWPLRRIADTADLVVFLSAGARLDPQAIRRAAFQAAASDNVVQPVMPAAEGNMLTPLSGLPAKKLSRYPFRDLAGFNLAVPAPLLRRIGLPDTRFSDHRYAGYELAFRMFRLGAYFIPLTIPQLEDARATVPDSDKALYAGLCPNAWDRQKGGRFEVPRVSVYIPAYNASKYIQDAIDSILDQDMQDLEVCIADDGSKDGTAALLERLYADEPRVRWQSFRNGGIGFASNRAIEMTRAPYIGQLDSDDRLKPGAVRRLMEYLDENPETACVYGSCERIGADGSYIKDEYSWPEFSREKMMITSIAHHFRMFRRAAWERTSHFREDIVNAVDYDIFLKLSEVGPFHHVDEVLYQRRWHGENTSNVNESFQTANTYRVQREALKRLGLAKFWDVHVPNPKQPRRVTYRRTTGPIVLFWPDYSHSNPYQHLLYGTARQETEICAGDIDAALKMFDHVGDPGQVTFHLHWLNSVLAEAEHEGEARLAAERFLSRLAEFVWRGGRLVWTIHNTVSHDAVFHDLEVEMSRRIAGIAHVLHFHSEASIDEVDEVFEVPRDKVRVFAHGSYVGVYPDFVDRAAARAQLGLAPGDDVILFSGQVRPYKGAETLVAAFRQILAERPNAVLLIAGDMKTDLFATIKPALSPAELSRIRATRRFVSNMEMQLFFRAADIAAYPYQKVLTSGSLLLALSFGVPAVMPSVGMSREILAETEAGMLYEADGGAEALAAALRGLLGEKDAGRLPALSENARRIAEDLKWDDFGKILV